MMFAACGTSPAPPPDLGADDGAPPPDLALRERHDGFHPAYDLAPPHGSGLVTITVLDLQAGMLVPARVIISAVAPTPAVNFDLDPHTGAPPHGKKGQPLPGAYGFELSPGVLGAPEGLLLQNGAGTFRLPAGTYDLSITRGLEYEMDQRRITVDDLSNVVINSQLSRSVDTTGWLGADLHVHSGRSFDSLIPLDQRVISEVAVGVEVIVATDHNGLTDFGPTLASLGYDTFGARLAKSVVGDEYNFALGHGGAFPMPFDPQDLGPMGDGVNGGGLSAWKLTWEDVKGDTLAQVSSFLRGFPTHPAVTVNHPRFLGDLSYFDQALGPNAPWFPPANLPDGYGLFDGMELLGGYTNSPEHTAVLLRDWFFFLNSGFAVTALGSSDTHSLWDVRAGFPRTWLRMGTDDPTEIGDSDVGDAVKAHRAIASNGPFATLVVDGKAQIGDRITNQTGSASLEVQVDAPNWMDVDHVRVYVNGQMAQDFPVHVPGLRPVFHNVWIQKLPPGDAWVAVQVGGSKPLPTALIGDHCGHAGCGPVVPFAITNPVFIDGDGDGQWTPKIGNPDPGPLMPQTFGAPEDTRPDDGWRWQGEREAADRELDQIVDPSTWRTWRPPGQHCEPSLGADPAIF